MPYLVRTLPRAERDLQSIFYFTQAQTASAAIDWFNGLAVSISTLAHHPARCAVIPENSKFRQLLYGSKPHIYRIIFSLDEESKQVNIVHVRHSARSGLGIH